MTNTGEPSAQAFPTAQEGEIVISGVDTGTPTNGTPTEMHALFQGLLEVQHEYPEPDNEDG